MSIRIPIFAIVGRPNVGKSTFFNRVIGEKRAVVEDIPGVTRDRNYAFVDAFRVPFYLVDTGGFENNSDDVLQQETRKQALIAVQEADVILFIVDGKNGLHPGDEDVISVLREYEKPFTVVVNKVDGKELETLVADFYQLGVDSVVPCSALHGRGISLLIEGALETLPDFDTILSWKQDEEKRKLDIEESLENDYQSGKIEIDRAEQWFEDNISDTLKNRNSKTVIEGFEDNFAPVFDPDEDDLSDYSEKYSTLPLTKRNLALSTDFIEGDLDHEVDDSDSEVEEFSSSLVRIAIIGRPNVGKSTILNSLLGNNRSVTSPIAGTTIDSIHERLSTEDGEFELIDTAGIRKKGKVTEGVERYSVLRSIRAISDCDVAVVVLDAEEGPGEQDAKIVGLAHEEGKGIVIVVNKWDLVNKDHTSVKTFENKIREEFKFVPYAPMFFVCGITGKRVNKILTASREVAIARRKRVPTRALNSLLRRELHKGTTPSYRGRPVKLYYAAQVDVAPPRFMLVFNYPKEAHFSYLRFIKNLIREQYGFLGTDIKLITKKRKNSLEHRR
ncbi:MAG TPA: ribosome biogenesis GTPase Der [Oligoflexia bacterium]|nr:ribosome biogenesis GTPase Der [Oligoflexia bacterium]HMP49166.1 ribosome biogenesis GTPase Der [Oligoflexia bacterium]